MKMSLKIVHLKTVKFKPMNKTHISLLLNSLKEDIERMKPSGHVSEFSLEEGQGEESNYNAGIKWGKILALSHISALLSETISNLTDK